MGVWLLRTSRRSILRPSGATADTSGSLRTFDSSAYTRVRPSIVRSTPGGLADAGPLPPRRCPAAGRRAVRPRGAAAPRTPAPRAGASPRRAAPRRPGRRGPARPESEVTPASRMPHGHDPVEPGVVGVAVQREAVHRDALGDADADRGHLAVLAALAGVGRRVLGAAQPGVELLVVSRGSKSRERPPSAGRSLDRVAEHPHAAAALDPGGLHAEVGAGADQRLLQPAHVGDHVHRAGQLQDGVADELARDRAR